MGSFLDRPRTEKETHYADGNDLRVAVSAMQGWRVDMEDSHTMQIGLPEHPDYSFVGVFDGHGGSFTARHSAANIIRKVTATSDWKAGSHDVNNISKAFVRGFLDIDDELRTLPEVARGDDHSGSTAIASIITPGHVVVANCGDSRSILVRDGGVIEMSSDHKPFNAVEQRRIEEAGGTVTMRRVNGDLAVSRALGDFVYKHMHHLPAEKQQVSAEPEIRVEARSDKDQFLVLACDGIWDVMTNEEVGQFLLEKTTEGIEDVGQLAEALLDECLQRGSRDNMSAVIVAFKNAPKPTKEAVLAYQKRREEAAAAANAGNPDDAGAH